MFCQMKLYMLKLTHFDKPVVKRLYTMCGEFFEYVGNELIDDMNVDCIALCLLK